MSETKPKLPHEKFIPKDLKVSPPDKNLHHIFDEADCYALWAAYSAGRPLLVRGKPGTGKSQMAKAIAHHLNWAFVSEVIRGSTELCDLHWHFDAIGRLGEAQAMSYTDDDKRKAALNPLNFLSPSAFWWAYNWESAEQQFDPVCKTCLRPKPEDKEGWHKNGVVLLIDEIDKAEPDLPNGLLETLGHYEFTVPYIDHEDGKNLIKATPEKLLVIITTNEERELPTAFVRRCFVHTLKMQESRDKLNEEELQAIGIVKDESRDEKSQDRIDKLQKRHHWLIERGLLHFGTDIHTDVYQEAAIQLWQDRDASHARYPAGLAEYIDLLTALSALQPEQQLERLTNIAKYALKKEVDE
jgi:MoxR-like ATPase